MDISFNEDPIFFTLKLQQTKLHDSYDYMGSLEVKVKVVECIVTVQFKSAVLQYSGRLQ